MVTPTLSRASPLGCRLVTPCNRQRGSALTWALRIPGVHFPRSWRHSRHISPVYVAAIPLAERASKGYGSPEGRSPPPCHYHDLVVGLPPHPVSRYSGICFAMVLRSPAGFRRSGPQDSARQMIKFLQSLLWSFSRSKKSHDQGDSTPFLGLRWEEEGVPSSWALYELFPPLPPP